MGLIPHRPTEVGTTSWGSGRGRLPTTKRPAVVGPIRSSKPARSDLGDAPSYAARAGLASKASNSGDVCRPPSRGSCTGAANSAGQQQTGVFGAERFSLELEDAGVHSGDYVSDNHEHWS